MRSSIRPALIVPSRLGRAATLGLEDQLDAQLALPRRLRGEDPSEIRCEGDTVGQIEIGPVEQVEDLPAQLEPHSLRHLRALLEDGVDLRHPWTRYAVAQ